MMGVLVTVLQRNRTNRRERNREREGGGKEERKKGEREGEGRKDFKELDHVFVEASKSKVHRTGWQARDSGELMLQF